MRQPRLPGIRLPRKGSTLILMTVSLTALFGMIGFVTDIGMAYFENESTQAAADAAALAGVAYAASNGGGYTAVYGSGGPCGVNGVLCQGATSCSTVTGTSSFASACQYAAANGYTDGTHNHTVTISANTGSPPNVTGVTSTYWVQATVTSTLPQLFSAVLGNKYLTVSSTSTATPTVSNANVNILVLGSGANTLRSAGALNFYNVDNIWVNSSDPSAVELTPYVTITSSVGKMHVVGGITGGATISPTPVTSGALADPFASVPNPNLGICTTNGDLTVTSGTSSQQPGLFCGNLSVTGTGSMSFSPGFYIITKNLTFNTTGTISADRAVFIMTAGSVTIENTGTVTMTPPDAGAGSFWANNGVPSWWQGISIFLEKTNSSQVIIDGGSTMSISGAIYAPSSDVIFCGGSAAAPPSQTIVSKTFAFAGNTNMYQGTAAVTPWTPKAALVH